MRPFCFQKNNLERWAFLLLLCYWFILCQPLKMTRVLWILDQQTQTYKLGIPSQASTLSLPPRPSRPHLIRPLPTSHISIYVITVSMDSRNSSSHAPGETRWESQCTREIAPNFRSNWHLKEYVLRNVKSNIEFMLALWVYHFSHYWIS